MRAAHRSWKKQLRTPIHGALIVAAAMVGGLVLAPKVARAQVPVSGCGWDSGSTIPIYLNKEEMATFGYDYGEFEYAWADVAAMINEQSGVDIYAYYAGITLKESHEPGRLNVLFKEQLSPGECPTPPPGRDAARGDYSCGVSFGQVDAFYALDCAGQPFNWTLDPYIGGAMDLFWQSTVAHELGHNLGLGHPPSGFGDSIMSGGGATLANLILYDADIDTLRSLYAPSPRRAVWVHMESGDIEFLTGASDVTSSIPPAIAEDPLGFALVAAPEQYSHIEGQVDRVAIHHGILPTPGRRETVAGTDGLIRGYVDVAVANSGQILALTTSDCEKVSANYCRIDWYHQESLGSAWTSGPLAVMGTHSRPSVSFDPQTNRFVVLFVDPFNGNLMSTSSPSEFPDWPDPAVASEGPFRFVGGAVFDGAGDGLAAVTLEGMLPGVGAGAIAVGHVVHDPSDDSFHLSPVVQIPGTHTVRSPAIARAPSGEVMVAYTTLFGIVSGGVHYHSLIATTNSGLSTTGWSPPHLVASGIDGSISLAYVSNHDGFVATASGLPAHLH